jgi:hypothetical protein
MLVCHGSGDFVVDRLVAAELQLVIQAEFTRISELREAGLAMIEQRLGLDESGLAFMAHCVIDKLQCADHRATGYCGVAGANRRVRDRRGGPWLA